MGWLEVYHFFYLPLDINYTEYKVFFFKEEKKQKEKVACKGRSSKNNGLSHMESLAP